jgi:hypothetical protein
MHGRQTLSDEDAQPKLPYSDFQSAWPRSVAGGREVLSSSVRLRKRETK